MADLESLTPEIDPERLRRMMALTQPGVPKAAPVAPDIQRLSPVGGDSIPASDATGLKPIGFKQRQALPLTSPGVEAGSSAYYQNKLERIDDQKANPLGSAENHPGVLGKIGHVLGTIGNKALDVTGINTIPGTEANREARQAYDQQEIGQAQTRETAAAGEKTRERAETTAEKKEASEEPYREAQTKALGEKDSQTLAAHGLMRDEEGNVKPDPTSPVYQKNQLAMDTVRNVQAYRAAQQELVEAKTEVERAKNDPNSPAFKMAQQRLAMAAEAHRVAAQNLALHQEQFGNKLQEQELVKPSGQSQSRGSAAQAVLDVIPDLKGLVQKNRDQMGPLMGRLNRGEITIGNLPPDIARLVSSMESFYALQPAVHGFKNFEVVKDFKTAMGTLERDPDSFIAGVEGLIPTLNAVAKEGKTSHKRIVEGRDTPAAAGGGAFQVPQGAPEAPKEDGHKLKQGGKVVAVSKGGQWQQP